MNDDGADSIDGKLDERAVQVWKTSIEVQMHFNELIMRNRTIVTSFITTIFGAAAYALKDANISLDLMKYTLPVSALIILFGVFFLIAYAVLDYCYYQHMLFGAVDYTEKMDQRYWNDLGLTTAITKQTSRTRAKWSLFIFYAILIFFGLAAFFLIVHFHDGIVRV